MPGFVARPTRVLRGRGRARPAGVAGRGRRGRGPVQALEAGDGRRRGASAGWRRGWTVVRAVEGSTTGFYLAQMRHDPWRGTAAPGPARQRSALLVAAMSALCRGHLAAPGQ